MYTILEGIASMFHPDEHSETALSRGEIVARLRRQIARWEETRRPADQGVISSGCGALDRLLPQAGFCRGTLVEWLSAGAGGGAQTLAIAAAREACGAGGALVVLDRQREFYPPAAGRTGIELDRLIVVHAANAADEAWILDQALRCPGVAAVLAWPEKPSDRALRRWQLAAEEGGTLGLVLRAAASRQEPSWADVRLLVEPLPAPGAGATRRLRIQLLHCRGGTGGACVEVECDDETHLVPVASPVVAAAPRRRKAGA
jgi:protein ImuA